MKENKNTVHLDLDSFYLTNAEESYDYHYVKTLFTMTCKKDKAYRVIQVSDRYRFENFQVPRYQSGLRQAHAINSEEAKYLFGDDIVERVQKECEVHKVF